jgi:hypothetical protein
MAGGGWVQAFEGGGGGGGGQHFLGHRKCSLYTS